MHTQNVNTATRESAEQFKTGKYHRYCVTDSEEREDFIQSLFYPVCNKYGSQLVTPVFGLQ